MNTEIFWKDIDTDDGHWSGLALSVERHQAESPAFRLTSGPNGRIKLMAGDTTLFWATISVDYYGVWLIRTFAPLSPAISPLPPVCSADVETRRGLEGDQYFKSWSRYVARQLATHSGSLLYNGHWLLSGLTPIPGSATGWQPHNVQSSYFNTGRISAERNTGPVSYIEWDRDLLRLQQPDPDSGRVKYWRKIARDGALPPVVCWYLNCLDSYVVIDGHDRLCAAELEHIRPNLIAVLSGEQQVYPRDPQIQQNILHSVEQAIQHPKPGKAIDIDGLNRVLIAAFDTRPAFNARTHSRATIASDKTWTQEVSDHLQSIGMGEYLEDILVRT